MMRLLAALLGLTVASLWATSVAVAATWGGIEPGVTTVAEVRDRWGPPSREARKKVQTYDTLDWVYEGDRAPAGMKRMTVEFGLLARDGFKPDVVRVLLLEPKPGIFLRATIVVGWGVPERSGTQDGRDVFLYDEGLMVSFEKDAQDAVSMLFTLPQRPEAATPGAPVATPPAAAPAAPARARPPASSSAPGPAKPPAPAPAPSPSPRGR